MGSLTSSSSNQKERSLSFTNKILAINMENKLNQNYRTGVLNWATQDFGSTAILNPLKLACWNPNPNVMVFGGGNFRGWLGWRVESSWMRLVPLQEEASELAHSFHHVKIQEVSHLQSWRRLQPEADHTGTMTLDFQPPVQWEMKSCCLWAILSMVLCYNSLNWPIAPTREL